MKRITILFLMVLAFFAVNAKEKVNKANVDESSAILVVSGTIADENSGESLVGVEVKIEGTDLKTYTDFDGKFTFKNVKPGDYKLTANYISYEKKSRELECRQ